jgi:hypothetical protein
MRNESKKYFNSVGSAEYKSVCLVVFASGAALLTSCMGETTGRRSAVDAAKLCNGDKNAVFAGTCLQRGSGIGAPAQQEGSGEEQLERERLEQERLAKERLEQEAKNKLPPAGNPPPDGPAEQVPPRAAVVPEVKEPPAPPQAGNDGKAEVQTRKLKFTRDTFVAVAQENVIRNCFVPADSVVVFTGELAPLNNFKNLGIKQNIVFKVTEVQYAKSEADECVLKGEDFLYLDGHAQIM